MPISFACSCGKKGSLKDEYAGKAVKCPACGATVHLPPLSGQSSAAEIDKLSDKIRSFLREKAKIVVDGTADIPKLDAFLEQALKKSSLGDADRFRHAGMAAQVACWALVKEGLAVWEGDLKDPMVRFPRKGVAFRVRDVAESFASSTKTARELLGIAQGFAGQGPPPRVSQDAALREVKALADRFVSMQRETAEMIGLDPPEFDYSAKSLLTVDKTIQESWGDRQPVMLEPLVESFGAYVGEVVVRTIPGASWHFPNAGDPQPHRLQGARLMLDIVVKVTAGKLAGGEFMICPFNWVYKRITDGEGDSIAFKYATLLKQAKGELSV